MTFAGITISATRILLGYLYDSGAVLALFVVAAPPGDGEAIAQARCAERLPQYSRPKWVREVGELPRTPTGKIQRFRLRELLVAELGREA